MTPETDIAILGAGPTGLALALALRESPWRVRLFDAAPDPATTPAGPDPRALALSEGSRQLLTRLDAWPAATAIRQIDISQRGGHASAGLYADALGLDALGHVVRYGELLSILRQRAGADGLTVAHDHRSSAITPLDGGRLIRFEHGATVSAQLVVHAEGSHDDDSWQCDYAQCAIVCEATPTLPHNHQAYERFTADGPLALLPLEDRYAVVRVVPSGRRAELLALDERAFGDDLTRKLGHRVAFSALGPRNAFPLALRLRPQLHRGQEVWIGNAAQTLHPVSGQGFNLGLRDAWSLAETLLALSDRAAAATQSADRSTRPFGLQKILPNATLRPGSGAEMDRALAAWARARQPDRLATTAFTDGIVRLFSNELAPLHRARELGLATFNFLPGLPGFVARRMIWGARGWYGAIARGADPPAATRCTFEQNLGSSSGTIRPPRRRIDA